MVKCIPEGGISNRLKVIISSLAEYNEICLQWDISSVGGTGCGFNDLFQNDFSGNSNRIIKDCCFIHSTMNTHIFGSKTNLDKTLQSKYIDVIKTLKPIDYVIKRVNTELEQLREFTTVSVRTFKSFPREFHGWGKHFNINQLLSSMNNITGKILLTCDDTDTVNILKDRYDVYITPKRTKFGDFSTVEGMQDILIDLYLGGHGTKIYGTNMSSFSEMQWWLGECKPKYNGMNLHKK